jgi:hypothetical protein
VNKLSSYPPPYSPQKKSILTENVYVPNDIENAIHHWYTAINSAYFKEPIKEVVLDLTTKHHPNGPCLNFRTCDIGFRLCTLSTEWEYSEWIFGLIHGHGIHQKERSRPKTVTWLDLRNSLMIRMDHYEHQFSTLHSFMGLVLSHLEQDEGFPHQTVKSWLDKNTELSPRFNSFVCVQFHTPH